MHNLDKEIKELTQLVGGIFIKEGIGVIPVEQRFLKKVEYNPLLVKKLLAHLQLLMYNYELLNNKRHNYQKYLIQFYFNFWRLKSGDRPRTPKKESRVS